MHNIQYHRIRLLEIEAEILTADYNMFVFLVFNAHLIILFAYRSLPDIPNAIISMPLIRNAIEIIIANRPPQTTVGIVTKFLESIIYYKMIT